MTPDWQAVIAGGRPQVLAVAHLDATPEAVWSVLGDHRALPRYLFRLLKVTVDNREAVRPDGPGAVRVISALGSVTRERVYAHQRASHLCYGLIGDGLVRNHVASLRLEPEGAGTRLTVRQFYERLPGLRGRVGDLALRYSGRRLAPGLVRIFGGRMVAAAGRG